MPFITQVLLPMSDNAGKRFTRGQYREFEQRMMQRFGGWTRKGQAEGAWLSPTGDIFLDAHCIYEVGHDARDIRFWRAEKEKLKEEFEQEDIWVVQFEARQI